VLGLDVPPERQQAILVKVGFEDAKPGYRVPTWRARDVTREIDLVEEVARFLLDEIPFTLPAHDVTFGRLTPWQRIRRRVEDVLAGCGFSEAYTPSFVAEGEVRLPEPLSQEAAALRTMLVPSLVAAVRRNVSVGASDVALFEIARTYRTGGALPDERWHVAGVVDGGLADAKWAVEQLYAELHVEPAYDRAPEPLLHPGKSARTAEGWVGELHPTLLEGTWGAFELDLDALAARAPGAVVFEEVSPYPEVRQDLAFVVDADVPAGALVTAMREAGGSELRSVRVFDEYRGDQIDAGKKSLAFRVAFGSLERTLTDEEATAVREQLVAAVSDRFGAVLRG
jgi:phenylalanyl-tRNA synthetase beta chain